MERDPGELSESRNEEGMEAFLVALTAGFSHREFRIGPKGCTVGSDRANCDIVASGATVSRRHFAITVQDSSQILLEDLHSTNGVYVNGRRIPSIRQLLIQNNAQSMSYNF